jgi:predicted TIM-barrel fold metal-dependent hydrolase
MMIDFHCHLWIRGYLPEKFWAAQARFFEQWYMERGEEKPTIQIEQQVFSRYWDPTGEKTLRSMDEAGIEISVLLPIDFGPTIGEIEIPIGVQNSDIGMVASAHPDRFVPFIGIDPRRDDALDQLKRGVEDWGARGVKFYGIGGFFPGEERGFPLLEWAEKKNLILLVHQGPLMDPFESNYCHPRYLEPVLKMFPGLRVVAAHMAFAWWRDLLKIARKYPSLYADISGWQLVAVDNAPKFRHIVRKVMDEMGCERVLFGTDGPTFDPFLSKKDYCNVLRNPNKGTETVYSEYEINAIFKDNAVRLLGKT